MFSSYSFLSFFARVLFFFSAHSACEIFFVLQFLLFLWSVPWRVRQLNSWLNLFFIVVKYCHDALVNEHHVVNGCSMFNLQVCIGIPCRNFKLWAFIGIMFQVSYFLVIQIIYIVCATSDSRVLLIAYICFLQYCVGFCEFMMSLTATGSIGCLD